MSKSELANDLFEALRDSSSRHAYAESFLNSYLATQIRVLREQRGLTQRDVADQIKTTQSGISAFESPDYSRWSLSTLKKLARVFDVRLSVTFETFASLIDDLEGFSREALQRPAFDDDRGFALGLSWELPAVASSIETPLKTEGLETAPVHSIKFAQDNLLTATVEQFDLGAAA